MKTSRRQDLRRAVGRALRQMRQRRHLSLDDVEQLTRQAGLRVTRSHLSRVETGSADMAVPRLLCLLRALGEPAAEAVVRLDALLDAGGAPTPDAWDRAARCASDDPAQAARILRPLASTGSSSWTRVQLELWADAEARIGCWMLACRASSRALEAAPGCAVAAERLAVSALGCGRVALAIALVRGAETERTGSVLIDACGASIAGFHDASAQLASRLLDSIPDSARARAVTLAVLAEAYRGAGRPRSALRAAQRAVDSSIDGAILAECLIATARAAGSCRRPKAGLRALARARRIARDSRIPALLARTHVEAQRMWLIAGERAESRAAARAARSLVRRHGADRTVPEGVPLYGLLELAGHAAPGVRSEDVGQAVGVRVNQPGSRTPVRASSHGTSCERSSTVRSAGTR